MLYLFGSIVLIGLFLGVLLVVGTLTIQGTYYTEPTEGAIWKAPTVAAALTLFFSLWCALNLSSTMSRENFVPYTTIFNFPSSVGLTEESLPSFVSVKNTGAINLVRGDDGKYKYADSNGRTKKVEYIRKKTVEVGGNLVEARYVEKANPSQPWTPDRVQEIIIEHNGEPKHFYKIETESGDATNFVSEDGWTMRMYREGAATIPFRFPTGLFVVCLLLNALHFGLWFVGLWLLLRFQWFHALLLSLALWLPITFLALPGLLAESVKLAVGL